MAIIDQCSRLLGRWLALCAIAELFGIASAAVWFGAINVWAGEPEALTLRIAAWFLMSLAAVPEGLILGGLQAHGLRWFFTSVSAARWIGATIAVGFLGWGIGTFIPMFVVDEAVMANGAEPGLAATALYSLVFGLGVGAVFGLAQAWALPAEARGRGLWVLANAIGWAIGLPLIFIAAKIAGDQSGWIMRVALWACGGIGAGASVGIATGIGLVWMTKSRVST
jgi:hypothetical protein